MKTLLLASLLFCGAAFAASPSINNDDSCDIKVGPAATLLLPYFEVDVSGTSGQTTLFTITNVTRYPQIAHVTLWTDWAYPVLTFNLFLTGYDTQAINLADVLARGVVAPPSGTTSAATPGALAAGTNPNLRPASGCASIPGSIPETVIDTVRNALRFGVLGNFPPPTDAACNTYGGFHGNAIGYATIDVVGSCTARTPLDPLYYTTDLLFDNVLIGDYQQVGAIPAGSTLRSAFDAAGNPMVHIRAVPEGGGTGSNVATALPYTFYDRYTPAAARTIDRRQPLPSTFAARYIQGGPAGYATNLSIWREGVTGPNASCSSYANNGALKIGEIVRFDEHENPFILQCSVTVSPITCPDPRLPSTSVTNTASTLFPTLFGPDVAGWILFNADAGGSPAYSITNRSGGTTTTIPTPFGVPRASQNWMTVTMFGTLGSNRMTAELDAASLGNGCSPSFPPSGFIPIAPAGGAFVCPPGTTLTNGTTALCTGTNANPQP